MVDKNGAIPAVIFRLNDEDCAVEVSAVREIVRMMDIRRLPQSSHSIEGIMNLRGHVIAVLDLRRYFGLPERENTDQTRIMIVRARRVIVGLIVDGVRKVQTFDQEMIQPTPAMIATHLDHRYISKIARWGHRIIPFINLDEVITQTQVDDLKRIRGSTAAQKPEDRQQESPPAGK